jgi:PhoH-like ATPase
MYNGLKDIVLSDEDLAKFYEGKYNIDGLLTNQYLVIRNSIGDYIDKYKFDGEKLIKVKAKAIDNNYLGKIKPLNIKQECYFDLLDSDVPVKLVTGGFGTGKSYLSTAWALQEIQKGKYDKLVIIRNNVDVLGVPSLGALPGTENDKLKPYCAFIGDIVSEELLDVLLSKRQIEIAYLGTMRGRSFQNCIILCSEAQNLTKEHVKLIIGRVAKGTTLIFDGDLQQKDKKTFENNNGLEALSESLKGNSLFGAITLDKVERSDVAQLAELIK